jgi:hypothetical protein
VTVDYFASTANVWMNYTEDSSHRYVQECPVCKAIHESVNILAVYCENHR